MLLLLLLPPPLLAPPPCHPALPQTPPTLGGHRLLAVNWQKHCQAQDAERAP